MSIIRFNTDEVFDTDSSEYEILVEAVDAIKVSGLIVEIGTRRGGSAKLIIDGLAKNNNTNRTMICIDPYGNITMDSTNHNVTLHYPGQYNIQGDPHSKDETIPLRYDYTNTMRNRIIPSLYYYAFQAGLNFSFQCLEDIEYFKRYHDGFPVYDNEKTIVNEYAFVFFDGPHNNIALTNEVMFFADRSKSGTVFVFDDEWMYDSNKIDDILNNRNFELIRRGNIKSFWIKK